MRRWRPFPNQNAIVTASLCTLAWLLARQTRWPFAVAAWTGAAVGVITVAAARLYVGWSSASETVTSMLLGVLWTAVFMVAWATRDRAVRSAAPLGCSADRLMIRTRQVGDHRQVDVSEWLLILVRVRLGPDWGGVPMGAWTRRVGLAAGALSLIVVAAGCGGDRPGADQVAAPAGVTVDGSASRRRWSRPPRRRALRAPRAWAVCRPRSHPRPPARPPSSPRRRSRRRRRSRWRSRTSRLRRPSRPRRPVAPHRSTWGTQASRANVKAALTEAADRDLLAHLGARDQGAARPGQGDRLAGERLAVQHRGL